MIRNCKTILFVFFVLASTIAAQTVTLDFKILGVSPRDAAVSTTDIYTYASTGLNNVGVGSIMYFQAAITGKKFGTVSWAITRRPSGAASAVGATKDVKNDSTQVAFYTPDKIGAYEITFTDGSYTKTITFNASKYLGYNNTIVNGVDTKLSCQTCHSSYVTKWQKTGHGTMFTRAMNATPGLSGPNDHYASYCVPCHTTGYDANPTAKNDGFDDLGFVYPAVITNGTYNQLVTQFPDAMKRANIQCESCHGPGAGHLGAVTDFRMQATYEADVCAYCHDSGTHHIFPQQWDASLHSGATSYPTGAGRESCVQCHTGVGFAQFAKGVATTDPYFDVRYTPITCAGCHDPHDATLVHQFRKVDADLLAPNNTTFKVDSKIAGTGAMCFNCHRSRSEVNAAVAAATLNSRFGPHYGPQGEILLSRQMLELGGVKLAVSNHLGASVDACVRCHMYTGTALTGTTVNQWGGHSFSMSTFKKGTDGKFVYGPDHRRVKVKDNMEACSQCHGGTFGNSFDDVKFFFNGNGDHDNDGVVEGLQAEVQGMVEKIMAELKKIPNVALSPEYGYYDNAGKLNPFPVPATPWTPDQRKAYWNAYTAYNDKSGGIHNPKYVISALRGAMTLLGLKTSVETFDAAIPTDYTLAQNFPNPFNPTTNIRFALPKSGNVKLTVYDAVGREVQTIVNNHLSAGTHTVEFKANNFASGVYLYKIEAGDFVKVNKMLLIK